MTTHEDEEFERLLVERERLRARSDPSASRYDHRIIELASKRGLSAEEVGDIASHLKVERVAAPGADPQSPIPLCGEYAISRPARFLPLVFGALLAAMVARLGAPFIAAALLAVLAIVHLAWPKRIARFVVDSAGDLHFETEASPPLDWQAVSRVEVKVHVPRLASELTRAARARLGVQLEMVGGQRYRFARGMFFQLSPVRRPLHHVHVERYLRARAKRSGMSISRSKDGFSAQR